MTLPGLPKAELQETLMRLERFHEASLAEYQQKDAEYNRLGQEIDELATSIKSIADSIAVVRHKLGLPQKPLQQIGASKSQSSDTADTTRTVMNIVADKHDAGGITVGEIYQALKDRGIIITRMYLHTILNRKKNRQKKLEKRGDKWFLTDKGKEELGIEV
jgi:hypothetical protein